jgi:hypothetical protein
LGGDLTHTPDFVSYLVTLSFPCYTNLMEVPHQHQYPYNPPLRLILLSWRHIPTGFSLLFGLILIALALIVGARRIWVERYLLLDNDSMVLPTGLFAMGTAKIEYTSIRGVWRHYIRPYEYRFVLKVATGEEAFKILPAFLPDNESYRALEEFLNRKLLENTRAKKSPRN